MAGVKGKSGGSRSGSGRKSIAEEGNTKDLCIAAITGIFGSPEDGIKFLLGSKEPSLIKFVFEHAYGKPTDKVENSGGLSITAFWDKTLIPNSDTPALPQE